jgi:hypothetical protein
MPVATPVAAQGVVVAAQPQPIAQAVAVAPTNQQMVAPGTTVAFGGMAASVPTGQGAGQWPLEADAFGFLWHNRTRQNRAQSLAGCYVGCAWWFCPLPCFMCLKFKAVDEHTLENDCCGPCFQCSGKNKHFKRNCDETNRPGAVNTFANASEFYEFGGANGLCAASSNTVCLARIC